MGARMRAGRRARPLTEPDSKTRRAAAMPPSSHRATARAAQTKMANHRFQSPAPSVTGMYVPTTPPRRNVHPPEAIELHAHDRRFRDDQSLRTDGSRVLSWWSETRSPRIRPPTTHLCRCRRLKTRLGREKHSNQDLREAAEGAAWFLRGMGHIAAESTTESVEDHGVQEGERSRMERIAPLGHDSERPLHTPDDHSLPARTRSSRYPRWPQAMPTPTRLSLWHIARRVGTSRRARAIPVQRHGGAKIPERQGACRNIR